MTRVASKAMALTIVFAMSGLAATARADGPGGDACAANLTPDGKAIYAVTVAAKPTLETLRSVVERETRSLAMADKIGRGDARSIGRDRPVRADPVAAGSRPDTAETGAAIPTGRTICAPCTKNVV